ncbi:MAG: LysO family transporter [Desulfovibrionaceae bacterium]
MKIFMPILLLSTGFAIGFCFKKYPLRRWLSGLLGNIIYILLFFLGLSLGSSESFYENIMNLGIYALLFSFICTVGSLIGAKIAYKLFFQKKDVL